MKKHPVRKFFDLTIIYAIAIIGIFIIQFKAESILSTSVGALHITLAQTESEDHTMSLRNSLKAAFKGLTVLTSENQPGYGIKSDGTKEILQLKEFSQPDGLSAAFEFKDGSTVLFSVTNMEETSELYMQANISSQYTALEIPYSITTSYNIEPVSDSSFIIAAKNNYFNFQAHNLADNTITFTKNDGVARFLYHDPSKRFTYEAVAGLSGTDADSYNLLVRQIRDLFVQKIQTVLASADADNLSELEVTAFIAEKTLAGKYNEGLDLIPDSFKKGNKRTYISTPYFNNLAAMNRSLIAQTERYDSQTRTALSSKNLEFFTIDGIDDYILREKNTSRIKQILSLPASIETFEPTAAQAAGILNIYTKLSAYDKNAADTLLPVLDKCINSIAQSCSLENNKITVKENEEPASVVLSVTIARTLIDYGTLTGHNEYVQTGNLIINSVLDAKNADYKQVAQIYRLIAPENKFYPHTEILGWYGNTCAWAWTCASSIDYDINESGEVSINIDFPLNNTHHIIFSGIPTFHGKIEIQNMMFRTDPRFETYNSSGYVYQSESKSLLIKSRHKSKVELIRLFCDPVSNFTDRNGNLVKMNVPPKAPAPLPAAATAASSPSTSANTDINTTPAPGTDLSQPQDTTSAETGETQPAEAKTAE